ncbi:MAG: hypothetical protein AB7F89_18105 [Pirellulaceae bacterium]
MKRLFGVLAFSAMLPWISGCGQATAPAPASTSQTNARSDEHGHAHGHGAGPHGGTLTDWGGGAYHVEFTVDHGKQEATVYLLGGDEKSPAPIKADKIQLVINDPMTEIELVAQPLDGETGGMSSRFVGTHATIGIVKEFSGTIQGVIEGTPYTGDFKEEPHGAAH